MEQKTENPNETENNVSVMGIAIRTLFYCLIFVSLFAVIVLMGAPYTAMRTSYDLGFERNSYRFARKFIERERKNRDMTEISYDSKYVDALIYAIELGDKFSCEKGYAQNLLNDTAEYVSVNGIDERNKLLDGYYTDIEPALRVTVYSYECYVYTLNAKAAAFLNKTENVLYRGEYVSAEELPDKLTNLDFSVKKDIFTFAVVLNQLKAYIDGRAEMPTLTAAVKDRFDDFCTRAAEYETDDLFRLFALRSALGLNSTGDVQWEYSYDGVPLEDVYIRLLGDYVGA